MLEKYDLFVVQHKILQYIRSVAPKVKNTFIDKAQTATIKKILRIMCVPQTNT